MSFFHKMWQQKLTSGLLVLSTLVLGILIGTILITQGNGASAQSPAASDATPLTLPPVKAIGNEFTQLAKNLEPSVVSIRVELPPEEQPAGGGFPFGPGGGLRRGPGGQGPQGGQGGDGDNDPDVRPFGSDGPDATPQQSEPRVASGTGFIVDKNGYILTNNHVVEMATKITVSLQGDPTEYRGRVVGTDCESDLAVVKINTGKTLKPVTIANSDSVQVGDWAVAIGSPFGLTSSVTAGIVSAVGRGTDQIRDARAFQRFIQTDAAINPGNSGGPLLNIKGEVIGVNTMIETATGGSNGVGFAVPINMGVRAYNDIIREGRVTRGSIGVNLATSEHHETLLKALGMEHGALIEQVTPDGPAAKGGMQGGDAVVAINGKPVHDNQDLISQVADLPVGKTATVHVERGGKPLDLAINIQSRSELYKNNQDISCAAPPSSEPKESKVPSSGSVQFGFQPRQLTDAERKQVLSGHGVVVTRVVDNSFAADVGLKVDDIIQSINRQTVDSVEDIKRVTSSLKPGDAVAFHLADRQSKTGRGRNARQADHPFNYLVGTIPGR